jgi:glutamate racemase
LVIGVFDSGVGGLSVWRQLAPCLPDVPMIYLGDQAHVPYGARAGEEVRRLAERCTRWLIERGCNVIVIACNTASADALHSLRAQFPEIKFVGMEPALKPAALQTKTGVIGVLATQVTLQGRLFASVKERFASNVVVLEQVCREWVELVERFEIRDWRLEIDSPISNLQSLISKYVEPLLVQNADTLVLGCTHFPFLAPMTLRVIDEWRATRPHAPEVTLIDPAPAVVRQAMKVWRDRVNLAGFENRRGLNAHEFWTTGDAKRFDEVASALLGHAVRSQQAQL